jgi:hypothetical protein
VDQGRRCRPALPGNPTEYGGGSNEIMRELIVRAL